jgi:hypothetical protein
MHPSPTGIASAAGQAKATLRRMVRLPDLALSVNNLAIRPAESGRRTEGLGAAQEAVNLYQELARTHPDDYGPKAAAADDLVIALTEIES